MATGDKLVTLDGLKAVYDKVDGDVGGLKSAITDNTGTTQIQFSDPALKQYINTSGSTVSWDTPSTSSTTQYKWAVVECNPGDVFTITGHGGSSPRLWAFADSSKNILDKSAAGATGNKLVLTAPTSAKYLIINDDSDSESYIGQFLLTVINGIASHIGQRNNYAWQTGNYSVNNGTRASSSSTTRICTVGYIDKQIKKIAAVDGYLFRVHAYNSDGSYVGTYTTDGGFYKTGSSENVSYFSFEKYQYRFKLTVVKADDSSLSLIDGNMAVYETAFGVNEETVSSVEPVNMCLAGIRTALVDNRIPYHNGFLFHKFTSASEQRELYYGPTFDHLKYIGQMGVNTMDRNFAISPKDGTIISRLISGDDRILRVYKDGTAYDVMTIAYPWLYNAGVDFVADQQNNEYCIYAEYGGNSGGIFKVYRGTYPYTSQSDWEVVKTATGETDIHHFHMVRRDPWTNIVYLTSGDSASLTHWWYSTDCGATWTELVHGSDVTSTWGDMACRTINFIFTEDYIYWATDSYKNHMLCRIQRDSETGIIDLTTFEKLADLKAGCATNSLCYSEAPYGLFMYERIDSMTGYPSDAELYYGTPVTMQFYSLDTNQLEDVVTLGLTETTWGGSRGKCYINYTNPNQPYPAMGFDSSTPCIFDLVYDDPSKIGTIVYDIKGGTVKDVLLE